MPVVAPSVQAVIPSTSEAPLVRQEPATPPRRILPVVAPSARVVTPSKSHESPPPVRTLEVIVAVPYEALHEFMTLFGTRVWETAAPYITKASRAEINALIAQRVPPQNPHIYKSSPSKRKHDEVEEALEPEEPLPKRERSYYHNRADGRPKPNRLLEIKRREEKKQWEQRKRELHEREEENRRHAAKLANFHVSSDNEDEDEPVPSDMPLVTIGDHSVTVTSPQTQIAEVATNTSTAESPHPQIAAQVLTASIQTVTEPLVTPQPTRRWGLGGLTQSVGRIFRFGNQPSTGTPVAPASAPHAPTQLALTASEAPPVEIAPSEPISDPERDQEAARRSRYMISPFPHYPLPSLPPPPATQPLTEAAPAGLNVARPSRRPRKDREKHGTGSSRGASQLVASEAENNLLVRTETIDDPNSDEPLEPQYDEESFRKAIDEQREKDLKELEKHKRKLDFELRKKQETMDLEVEERVKAQLANKSKKRRRASPKVIPNPAGVSYGIDPDYFVVSEDDDDNLPDTPTKQPSKRQRSGPVLLTPPRRPPKMVGSAKSARPYTGSVFADPAPALPENIFDPATHKRGGLLPQLDRDTERKAEVWDANPTLASIPEAHRNYAGSFVVPVSPDSSSDDESTASTTPTGSPSKSAAPDTDSSEKSSGSWTQPPPRAPVPSPAALPKQLTHTPVTQPDLLAKAREQANRFAPTRPSGLRNASRVSLSTIASESDREEDQAENVTAPTPTTSKTAATFALLTEPAKISPTKQAPIASKAADTNLDAGRMSSSGSAAVASRPEADSPTVTSPNTGSLTTTRPDASSLTVPHPEANSLTISRPESNTLAKETLTLESLQRPSLAVTSKLIHCSPYNLDTYRSVETAMASLDPNVRTTLRMMRPEEFLVPSFDDFSWAHLPSNDDPTPNVDAALAQVARLTELIDPNVEAALRALRREDLAPIEFADEATAPPQASSNMNVASDSDEATLLRRALAENWTAEAQQSAENFFEGATFLYKEWQGSSTGQTFTEYFKAHDPAAFAAST